jgi:hypothetical protein
MVKFLLWLILLAIPFRLIGVTIGSAVDLVRADVGSPARLLGR